MSIRDNIIEKRISILYFVVAFAEVAAEYFTYKPMICYLKPILPIILIVLYLLTSNFKKKIFIAALLFSVLTNIFFITNTPEMLYYGVIANTFHRILAIILVLQIVKIKDFIPFAIASIPFLLIFFYLFFETSNIPENSYVLLIFQNLLISMYAGIALSCYVMNDNKVNSILLISTLLFVMLHFVVFIERYYLSDEYISFFRPTAMTFNALAFYSLYKFVITAERLNNNGSSNP